MAIGVRTETVFYSNGRVGVGAMIVVVDAARRTIPRNTEVGAYRPLKPEMVTNATRNEVRLIRVDITATSAAIILERQAPCTTANVLEAYMLDSRAFDRKHLYTFINGEY